MSIIGIVVALVIVGAVLYLLNTVLPLDPKIRTIINVIVVLAVCVWLLQALGLLTGHVRVT